MTIKDIRLERAQKYHKEAEEAESKGHLFTAKLNQESSVSAARAFNKCFSEDAS